MTRRRIGIAAAGGVLLLVAAGGAYLFFSVDAIVKRRIEALGTAIAGVDLTVERVELSLREGSGRIRGLRLANPPGYSGGTALEIDEITLRLEPASVAVRPIVIDDVSIGAPRVRFEVDARGHSNFEWIDRHAREEEGVGAEIGAMRLAIARLAIAPGSVTITAPAFLPGSIEAPVEGLTLSDLGSRSDPMTAADVAQHVEEVLVHRVAVAVATTEIDRLVRQKLGGAVRGVTDVLLPRPVAKPVDALIGGALDLGTGIVRDALRETTGD
jgi:hypothetical protein